MANNFSNSPADPKIAFHAEDAFDEDLSLMATRDSISSSRPMKTEDVFPFMDLPTEIRLRIYGYLLPSRTHMIVTQYPLNGFFYNTSTIPVHSAQSFYSFGRSAPKDRLTTYKVLNTNFRADFPSPRIFPEIFRVCKQIRMEAEPILYGASETIFDFGVHSEAVKAFFGDRSAAARASVRNVRIAKEIPEGVLENSEWKAGLSPEIDPLWDSFCDYLRSELSNIRTLDLTVWSSIGSVSSLPASGMATALTQGTEASGEDSEAEIEAEALAAEQERLWREWEWTREMLRLEALRGMKITWWGFNGAEGREGKASFDSWLARRMVGDTLVRDRMVRDGVVIEGVAFVKGSSF